MSQSPDILTEHDYRDGELIPVYDWKGGSLNHRTKNHCLSVALYDAVTWLHVV